MDSKLIVAASCAILTAFLSAGNSFAEGVQTKTIVSGDHTIDRLYPSMRGPAEMKTFRFGDRSKGGLIWLTGAKIETVDKKNKAIADSYLCHTNLDIAPNKEAPQQHYISHHQHDDRIIGNNFMDLVQGQPEIQFPPGYAIPLKTDDQILFHSMALNSRPVLKPFDIRFKASFNYIRDEDLDDPLKPLALSFLNVRVPAQLPTCLPPAFGVPQHDCGVFHPDESGGNLNVHWLVPPGRATYRYELTEGLGIPFDTTAHYISMHLHPFAESMELVDLTAGETIFTGNVKYFPNKRDIEQFEFYSSEEGIPIYLDHDYELRTVYNNTTGNDIDAMAVLYIYYWDKKFNK